MRGTPVLQSLPDSLPDSVPDAVSSESTVGLAVLGAIVVLLAAREGYLRYTGRRDSQEEIEVTAEEEDDTDTAAADEQDDEGPTPETELELDEVAAAVADDMAGDDDESGPEDSSLEDDGDDGDNGDGDTFEEWDFDEEGEPADDSGGIVDTVTSYLPWTEEDDDEEFSLQDDPELDDESLGVSAEFDDILNEDVKKAIADEDQDVTEAFEESDQDLPDYLQGDEVDTEEFLFKLQKLHRRQIAPDTAEKGDTHYQLGDQYTRVMFAHKMPPVTPVGGLKKLMEDPELHFDSTIHFHHLDQQKALRSVKNLHDNLAASVNTEAEDGDELNAGDKLSRMHRVRDMRDEMKQNNEKAFNMTMYVGARGEDEEQVLDTIDDLREEFRIHSDIRLKTIERNQKKALKSLSPAGVDPVYDDSNTVDPEHVAMGKTFGSIMASVTKPAKFEPTGHEWGVHAVQGNPIVKDPFESTRNYNMVVVGESGSGKSLNAKKMALETRAVKPETLIIILDPLQGFYGLSKALDAQRITVGSQQRLNPMEIRKPPEEHINSEAFDEDRDPLGAKIDDVMSFLQNYVAQQPGLTFGDESQLLRTLIMAAYKKKGITHEVRTHDRESPTLTDVYLLAKDAKEDPESWTRPAEDPEEIERQASEIGKMLRAFGEGGRYEHLAKQPEEDIFEGHNNVIYLDLSQQEASGGSGTGVMGQLMFSMAYEMCKQHHGPCMYIIDESRFLFREADTLDYLAQRVRHSRHYDTSIRFITQEMDDFFEFEQAEGIVNNSSYQVIHQSADVDEWGDRFDLNDQHKKFVKNAATGKKVDYSQALVKFPDKDQWFPLTIEMGDNMLSVADFDEQEDRYEELPGYGPESDEEKMSPVERELVARIRTGAKSHEKALETILQDWERPAWDMLTEERSKQVLGRIADGQHPRKALYTEALEQVEWLIEATGGEQVASEVVDRLVSTLQEKYQETYKGPERKEVLEYLEEEGQEVLNTSESPEVVESEVSDPDTVAEQSGDEHSEEPPTQDMTQTDDEESQRGESDSESDSDADSDAADQDDVENVPQAGGDD